MKEKFIVGGKVEWESQARGYKKKKIGEIVEIVWPGYLPSRQWEKLYRRGIGSPRENVSYIVKVGSKLYWPRTSALKAL